MPESDYVRSRLTHSIEVSVVGRSLGKLAGEFIIKKEKLTDHTSDDFSSTVVAACLAHDIGNPPFGHSGEKAIGNFFATFLDNNLSLKSVLSKSQIEDLIQFEGNAAGFRILTNDHPSGRRGGLRLTYATLGAFSKYPCGSYKNIELFTTDDFTRKSLSKFGYFEEEKVIFKKIAEKIGLLPINSEKNQQHGVDILYHF